MEDILCVPAPIVRDIVVQQLGDETLTYNLTSHKAYSLNTTSSIIYRACDGRRSISEIQKATAYSEEIVHLAIDELVRSGLVEANNYRSPFAGMSRREVIKKVGVMSVIALPIISNLVAPTAIHATSAICNAAPTLAPCTSDSDCESPSSCPTGYCHCHLEVNCCIPNGGGGDNFTK